jgi:hypothetical protein
MSEATPQHYQNRIAVWLCPCCATTRTLTLPTSYTFSLFCDHWHGDRTVVKIKMEPLTDAARALDTMIPFMQEKKP